MQPFIPAADLKQTFSILGHFYTIKFPAKKFPAEAIECRSVLEIIDKSIEPQDSAEISERQPDAVFIMMNPGGSKPLVPVSNLVPFKKIDQLTISLVPTRPDTTQYQVMRLMRCFGWRHVRVLNLSDLRSPKSPIFIQRFQQLEREVNFDAHSVFSEVRQEELAAKLPKSRQVPIVLAWGMSEKLNPLIERCLSRLTGKRTIHGWLAEGTTNKYRHPLPTLQRDQIAWVNRMVELIGSS